VAPIINLRSPIRPRERTLAFGIHGTGKSKAILDVARRCPSDTFYVADTDLDSYERLLATEYTDLNNVEPTPVTEWVEWKEWSAKVTEKMGYNDWCTFDIATSSWDMVQGWFVENIHGEHIEDYFLERRQQKANLKEAGGDKKGFTAIIGEDGDWQVINKQYFKFFYTALAKMPGHVYLTAEQVKVDDGPKGDEKDTIKLFGPHGVKPKGQKRLGHMPHTVMMFNKVKQGKWTMTTVKDRGRVEVEQTPLENFASDYLMKVAGWKMEVQR
jgi:hypothetical protein